MHTAAVVTRQHAYGVTYASFDEEGLHFESELSLQLDDGSLLTLKMPTQQNERLAIHQLLCP
ncbi:MAG TPA: type III secretion system co-regulatory protein PtrC [Pseudomonas sp.]|nr:type III secretion system co-regulatory protein PtrC [Pseudomonas sp.]